MSKRRAILAPEGARIIIVSAILVVIAVAFSILTKGGKGIWLPAATSIWFLAVIHFFRDPLRITPSGERIIVSPADGKIISIGDAINSPLTPAGQRVSVFMSPFNVHVNRAPFNGSVISVEHRNGRFKSAFKPSASNDNEQVEVLMDTSYGKLAFRQIAGFLARRIVFHPKPGDKLTTGQRVGMIRFGSRVDLFLPESAILKVNFGDKVTAGVTIIGEFDR
ncbi:MAG: phosphatidylserine decarboxylase family protein [Calditrichaeota bacterium]|nr:phosphatidylserine decarboxylase family protein [Calditrichota bacterium]